VGLVLHFGPRPVVKRVVRSRHYSRLATAPPSDEREVPIVDTSSPLEADQPHRGENHER
jgi:hypothetical protein